MLMMVSLKAAVFTGNFLHTAVYSRLKIPSIIVSLHFVLHCENFNCFQAEEKKKVFLRFNLNSLHNKNCWNVSFLLPARSSPEAKLQPQFVRQNFKWTKRAQSDIFRKVKWAIWGNSTGSPPSSAICIHRAAKFLPWNQCNCQWRDDSNFQMSVRHSWLTQTARELLCHLLIRCHLHHSRNWANSLRKAIKVKSKVFALENWLIKNNSTKKKLATFELLMRSKLNWKKTSKN